MTEIEINNFLDQDKNEAYWIIFRSDKIRSTYRVLSSFNLEIASLLWVYVYALIGSLRICFRYECKVQVWESYLTASCVIVLIIIHN